MDKDIFQKIGKRISVLRKKSNVTQIELAQRLKVSQSMITDYERGKKTISIPRLLEISKVLKVSPGDILDKIK